MFWVSVSISTNKVRVVAYAFRHATAGVNPEEMQPDTTQSSVDKVSIYVYGALCMAHSF